MGRKRHLDVDTPSLLLGVWVTAASVSDNTGGIHLLPQLDFAHHRLRKAWADNGYHTTAIDQGARLGIDVEIVQRDPEVKGFKVQPRR